MYLFASYHNCRQATKRPDYFLHLLPDAAMEQVNSQTKAIPEKHC